MGARDRFLFHTESIYTMASDKNLDSSAMIRARLQIAGDPKEKLSVILSALERLMDLDVAYAAELLLQGRKLAARLRNTTAEAFLCEHAGTLHHLNARQELAFDSWKTAYSLFLENGLEHDASRMALALARGYREGDDERIREASQWLLEALEYSGGDDLLRGEALEALGLLYHSIGDYPKALEYVIGSYKCREQAAGIGEPYRADLLARTLHAHGTICISINDLACAESRFAESRELFHNSGNRHGEVQVLSDLGHLYCLMGRLPLALECELKALPIYEDLGDRHGLGSTLHTIGLILERQNEFDKAGEYHLSALDILEPNRHHNLRATIIMSIGNVYGMSGHYHDARFVYEQGLMIACDIGDKGLQHQLHLALANVYEELGELKNALTHLHTYTRLHQELSGRERQRAIAMLQTQFDIDKAEQKRMFYQRKVEDLEAEVQRKENRQTELMFSLEQKNRLIKSLKTLVRSVKEQIREMEGENRRPKATRAAVEVAETLKELDEFLNALNASDGGEDSWIEQMGKEDQEFIRKLSKACPKLTNAELPICLLIRRNQSTKQIASHRKLAQRTVETHRLNIRRKLKSCFPDMDANLTTFLSAV